MVSRIATKREGGELTYTYNLPVTSMGEGARETKIDGQRYFLGPW